MNWEEQFDEIYPPLFIDNGFDLVEEEGDKKQRKEGKQFIQNLLDKQKSEIKEMMNKKFKGLIEELELDTETLKYILKQLK